ncbi:NAD+ synthase [Thiobacillus denitrificans]|uniref:Glutamine-dependent NAD(+) synthetase n=1 Tax=Thiobacillus denitrificans TaxID=36861 RepID=A0A119CUN3_THIDE|nr:NAD+ synthase [Thiobacillus denitrificans]KVW93393.1 NAD synthetase [Thiobacillus denitrificans]
MKLGIAQLNLTVGDIAGNAAKLLAAANEAHAAGAALLLTPEMSICGYPAEDLVLRSDFTAACAAAVEKLAAGAPPELALIVGYPERSDDGLFNAAALLRGGRVETVYRKHHLPNYSVFDEQRVFDRGDASCVFACGGLNFGLNICGDIWEPGPATRALEAGADWLLVPNASPYHLNKARERLAVARSRLVEAGLPIIYANLVGGQDELVFDGASFALNTDGEVVAQCPAWQEGLFYLELAGDTCSGSQHALPGEEAAVYDALVLAVRDYFGKNGFKGVHLGLSGGIDSALTLAIAADAIGPDKVHAVMMPSDYTASISVEDSRDMVKRLGVRYSEIAIKPIFDSFVAQLAGEFAGLAADTTEENLQARTRGTLLMALSNKFGTLVLTTGNKSEMAAGYATLYGDMAGGFAVLKDVAKTRVYRLANYRNSLSAVDGFQVIPQRIIDRPPSAELRPDQTDQDSLPPYDVLDAILEAYVERDLSARDIVAQGFDAAIVRRVIRMVDLAEYKRRQAPPGPRITPRNFGKDRRYPITSKYRPEGDLP